MFIIVIIVKFSLSTNTFPTNNRQFMSICTNPASEASPHAHASTCSPRHKGKDRGRQTEREKERQKGGSETENESNFQTPAVSRPILGPGLLPAVDNTWSDWRPAAPSRKCTTLSAPSSIPAQHTQEYMSKKVFGTWPGRTSLDFQAFPLSPEKAKT